MDSDGVVTWEGTPPREHYIGLHVKTSNDGVILTKGTVTMTGFRAFIGDIVFELDPALNPGRNSIPMMDGSMMTWQSTYPERINVVSGATVESLPSIITYNANGTINQITFENGDVWQHTYNINKQLTKVEKV